MIEQVLFIHQKSNHMLTLYHSGLALSILPPNLD